MNRRLLGVAAALGIATIAAPAHAYVRESTNWNPSSLPISYYVNQGTIPASLGTTAGVGAVEGGFATWASPSCTRWSTTDAGNTTTVANTGDRRNVIMWVNAWPAELGSVSSVIGVTTPVWSSGGYFIDADIQFNNQGFRWNTTGTGGGNYVDAQSIATHEEGHFLGLDHSPTTSAIMYASYSGGLKRTLATDDQNGVCAIYPSGVAPTDTGVAPVDAGTSSGDPCSPLGSSCDGCTPYNGCGWCADSNQCLSGTRTGPLSGSCGSWAWYQTDCASVGPTDAGTAGVDAATSGGGRFGDPCTQPTDCGSGGICAVDGTGNGFCTRACSDDCTCPTSYQCYDAGSISVCVPGANACSSGTDAGMVIPGDDAAVIPGDDAAVIPGDDASVLSGDDAGGTTGRTHAGGCGCTAAGTGSRGLGGGLLGLALVGLFVARRRR